uniref:Uncharacterized protein n=1 Tax=Streptomyces sp. NBC_00049 TaxID=2903617 RepID=A0AAU2JQC4_9ACTN
MTNQLQPIDGGLSPEARALAAHLRDLFHPLETSVRRFATRCHSDAGTVSRYLNGTRIPPWAFVRVLLAEVGAARQQPLRGEVLDHTRKLHRAALRVSNRGLYELQTLQDQLEQADREQRQAGIREQALLEALQARQQRIADLEITLHEIEGAGAARQAEQRELVLLLEGRDETAREEIERLREEVDELRNQLAAARELVEAAEERCVTLESQLEMAEIDTESGQELRDAESLHLARQDAAEANDRAARLQEELNDVRRLTAPQPQPPRRDIPAVLDLDPAQLCKALQRVAATGSETEWRSLALSIGEHYPTADTAQLVRELKDINDQIISMAVCSHFSSKRGAQDVFDLIDDLGWGFLAVGGASLWRRIITWFTWEARLLEIQKMLYLTDQAPVPEVTIEIFNAAAGERSPEIVMALLERADYERRQMLVGSIAARREVYKIPSLLEMIRARKEESYLVDQILSGVADTRPGVASQLIVLLEAVGSKDDVKFLRSHLA